MSLDELTQSSLTDARMGSVSTLKAAAEHLCAGGSEGGKEFAAEVSKFKESESGAAVPEDLFIDLEVKGNICVCRIRPLACRMRRLVVI